MPAQFDPFRLPPLPRLRAMGAEAAAVLLDRHARELKRIQVDPYAPADVRRRANEKLPRVRSLLLSIEGGA